MFDIIYPVQLTCLCCDVELAKGMGKWLCPSCEAKVLSIEGNLCKKCGKPIGDEW